MTTVCRKIVIIIITIFVRNNYIIVIEQSNSRYFVFLLKILNSRWVSSSRDVVALRQTLLNPSSCSEFTAFVSMKGDTLESNVQFWLEVQKFKVRLSIVKYVRSFVLQIVQN